MPLSNLQGYNGLQSVVAFLAGRLVEQLVMLSSRMTPNIRSVVLGWKTQAARLFLCEDLDVLYSHGTLQHDSPQEKLDLGIRDHFSPSFMKEGT